MKKVLFLHGWSATGSMKVPFVRSLGYDVLVPRLSDWSFWRAVMAAQMAFSEFSPAVIVGSSRGGAIALSMEGGDSPLILLAPAWTTFSSGPLRNKRGVVIHSTTDQIVPFADSVELCSRCQGLQLIPVGRDHMLNCPEARAALAQALREFTEPHP